MAELKQTVGKVRIEGLVVGFNSEDEKTFKTGTSKAGKEYKSATLVVKTNDNNVIYDIGIYGQVKDTVKLYGKVNGEKQKIEVAFAERNNRPAGFTCFGFGTVRTGFEKDANNKVIMKNYFNYDGAEIIAKSVDNDVSVWIDAAFNVENYVSNGEPQTRVKYNIEGIGLQKSPIDFTTEGFKEVASFEQEFVVLSTDINKETKKVYVNGRIIGFDQTWKDLTFVVDGTKYETLAQNVYKKLKFGDLLTVQGIIRNGTELVEVKEQALDWGGETPRGQGKANKNTIRELQITQVIKHTAKVYKEDDFVVEENPFKQEDDSPISISDDELPW